MRIEKLAKNEYALFFELAKSNADVYALEDWASAYGDAVSLFFLKNEKEETVGGFIGFEKNKYGFKMLITPPFASNCALFLVKLKSTNFEIISQRKKAIDALANFIKEKKYHYIKLDLPAEFNDVQPAIWKSLRYEVKYTYRLDLTKSEGELKSNLHSNIQRKIEQTLESSEFELSQNKDEEKVYRLFTGALHRNGGKWNETILRFILKSSLLHYTLLYKGKDLASAALHAGNGKTAFYLFGSNDRELSGTKGGARVLWESICAAKKQGFEVYDFEGSMIEGVEYFFRSFGGEIVPTFVLKGGRGLWPRLMQFYFGK